jgi:hypothetical protein
MAEAKKKSVFETLSAINVNDKIENKKGMKYLSWVYAWSEVKKVYPLASFKVIRDPQTDKPWFYDPTLGYMCMTSVTIDDETHEMFLPVMNGANKAMLDKPYSYTTNYGEKEVHTASMFDVNKTIMRCLVKNLAMHGLGHYVYTDEEMPEAEAEAAKLAAEEAAKPKTLKVGDDNWDTMLQFVADNKEKGLEKIVSTIERKYKITAAVKKEIKSKIEEK